MQRLLHSAPEHGEHQRPVTRRPVGADVTSANDMLSETMTSIPLHPRGYHPDLPVSGAWREGDPVGRRRFLTIATDHPFVLSGGGSLERVTLAYETWGELGPDASNAILVCHALTGDSHAAGSIAPGHPSEGWWNDLIGPGCAIDTSKYFVVCVNTLGGCQGTTGPSSIDPATGQPYGSRFPAVTIRDIVRTQAAVADHLGVDRWHSIVGGSMGGMQVLEWGVMYPDRVRSLAPLASTVAASAQQVAWSAVGRTALALDARWRGGDYYDAEPGDGPHAGLAIARAIAQITYRSEVVFADRFHRELVDPHRVYELWDRFQVESYLDHHGEKLVRRFDANSYVILNRAMDLHDIGWGRGGVRAALQRLNGPVMTLSISSDALYPPYQQREMVELLEDMGIDCDYRVVESDQGHDGFLLEAAAVGEVLSDLFDRVGNSP